MSAKQRPTGVTILAILALLGGILDLFGAFGMFSLAAMSAVANQLAGATVATAPLAAYGTILGVILLVIGVLAIAFAIGAWMLKSWGWTLGIVVEALAILLALVTAVLSGDIVSGLIGQIIGIVISAAIIYYLLRPEIKQAFGRA
jgi:hypothetical protein